MEILIVILLVVLQFAYQLYVAAQRRSKRLRQGTIKKQEDSNDPFKRDPWKFDHDEGGAAPEKKGSDVDYPQTGTGEKSSQNQSAAKGQFEGGAFDALLRGGQQISKAFEDRFVAPIERAYDVMYDRDGVVVKELSNTEPEGKEVKTWYHSQEAEDERAADVLEKARQRLLQKKSKTSFTSEKTDREKVKFNQVANRVGSIKKMLKAGDRKKAIMVTEIISKPVAFVDSRAKW